MLELHTCKHCGQIFERAWNQKRLRPSVCVACNPRRQWARCSPEAKRLTNVKWREKNPGYSTRYARAKRNELHEISMKSHAVEAS